MLYVMLIVELSINNYEIKLPVICSNYIKCSELCHCLKTHNYKVYNFSNLQG